MAESDSRNAGRGRIAAKVADTQRPQITGSVGNSLTQPLIGRALPKVEVAETNRPVLRAVAGEAPTPNPQLLKVLPQPLASRPPFPALAPTVGPTTAPVPLRPSLQMTTLAAAPLSAPQFGSAYNPQTLNPAAGEYSYDPQITLPEHRFLTPSEL